MSPATDAKRGLMLILFDIDGTLVQVKKGLSRKVFKKAFSDTLMLEQVRLDPSYSFHGRTDRSIFFDLADVNGIRLIDSSRRLSTVGLFR